MNEGPVKTIRQLRAGRLWSERDLAREAGLSRKTVHDAESGAVVPRNETIRSISAALGVEPAAVAEFRAAIETRSAAA